MSETKATIQHEGKTVTFEGPREFVEAQVDRYLKGDLGNRKQGQESKGLLGDGGRSPHALEQDLIAQKSPRNHPETVAVLAYALSQSGIEEFSKDDIRKAYLRVAMRPPKSVSQALRDAKNNYDYVRRGSERGSYRLTTHGERTVLFDLPRA